MNIAYLSESHLILSAAWAMECYEHGYQDGLSRYHAKLAAVRIVVIALATLIAAAVAVIWRLWQSLGALA